MISDDSLDTSAPILSAERRITYEAVGLGVAGDVTLL